MIADRVGMELANLHPRPPALRIFDAGIGDAGGEFASELGTNPGVLGVFNINFASGSLACPVAPSDTNFGAAFVYGSGPQSPTNSYDIPAGQPDSAWKVPVTEAFCDSYPLAVAGGPSGFGVLIYLSLLQPTRFCQVIVADQRAGGARRPVPIGHAGSAGSAGSAGAGGAASGSSRWRRAPRSG